MVVVDTIFPLADQLEEFRRALRLTHVSELFTTQDWPRFLGLNILKFESTPGQPDAEPTWLVRHEGDKVILDPALQSLLREAILDESLSGAQFVFQGLVMAHPKMIAPPLGIRDYPKPELDGIGHMWDLVVPGGQGVPAPGAIR